MSKVALVTGISRGLGLATALAFAKAGYWIAGCYRTPGGFHGQEALGKALLEAGAERYLLVTMDVSRWDEVGKFHERVEASLGPVDVLVNNAGVVHRRGTFPAVTHQDLAESMGVHFYGAYNCIYHVLPSMLERKTGTIINVASKAARYAVPGFAAYNASKAALVSLTQTLAWETQDSGVRIYSVSPGGMNTEMREKAYGKEDAERQQDPQVVASMILILTSDNPLNDGVPVPHGADILVWKGEVEVFPMEKRT